MGKGKKLQRQDSYDKIEFYSVSKSKFSYSWYLRGHHGWILEKNCNFHLFYFILNDIRIHLVVDHISFFRLIIHAPLKKTAAFEG